ncbi:hypothetical protein [Neorhizobium alkalisoli]|uniref:hypothetical protein n=1 Tax=Neorhizobium alkalisoli TaxID=528178 RepID=UPI0011A7CA32|nr:hypothetical protein [Neorhizobium alkalisoli]
MPVAILSPAMPVRPPDFHWQAPFRSLMRWLAKLAGGRPRCPDLPEDLRRDAGLTEAISDSRAENFWRGQQTSADRDFRP